MNESQFQIMPKQTVLDELVARAAQPEDILQAWDKHPGNSNQAGNAFKTWTHLMIKTKGSFKEQSPELWEDPRLENMMTTISQKVASIWNRTLVSTLQALWIINLPSIDPLLKSVQTETLWRVRRLNYKQLAYLVNWGAQREGREDMAIVNTALKHLELRWTEITDAKTVATLLSKAERMSPTLLDKLEDKTLEIAEGLSSEDIRKIFVSLATQSRRPVPLLRALSYHFLQKSSLDFTTPLMLDMAFAYGKLNFHHTQVFQRMAAELLPKVGELSPSEVVRFTKSFGFLKWLHFPLFEAFAEHFISNNENYSLYQLSNLLMAFARLGFQPQKGEEFYNEVHHSLENSFSNLEPFIQTDVAWSLCILQQSRPQYLIPLLQEQHISTLTVGAPSQQENYLLKLLHIAASLQMEHPGSFNTVESQSALTALLEQSPTSAPTDFQIALTEVLYSLVDHRKDALRVDVDTIYGWNIDGEMIVDRYNKPISLTSFKAPHLPNGGGKEPLPKGARRIAFKAWKFPNFSSKSKELLGRFVMMKRHLQLAGFVIVEVPFYDWLQLKNNHQRVSYLKDKIRKAVAEDMAK